MTCAVTLTARTRLESLAMTELEALDRETLEAYAYTLQTRLQSLVRNVERVCHGLSPEVLADYQPEHPKPHNLYYAEMVGWLDSGRTNAHRDIVTALSLIETFTSRDVADARAELPACFDGDDPEVRV